MARTKQQHLDPTQGPKRILSLDGGGIRGVLTLQYLKAIETMLRARFKDEKLLLSDYFDLIGGTSTGSIIAAGLACGMTVDALDALYTGIGSTVFETQWWAKLTRNGVLAPKFPDGPLKAALDDKLDARTTLDGDRIRTGLMIMTKRLDTGSPWPLHNGPGAYAAQDGKLLLTEIVRASTAAPTYFEPQPIRISARDGSAVDAAFVDGGVSPFNDPALQLLMLAALEGHGLRWKTGADQLLIVSVGTGGYRRRTPGAALLAMPAAQQGIYALSSLMDDCGRSNHAVLQWLTTCLTPSPIDSAVGDMRADSLRGPKLATYVRYNVLLEQDWLKTELGVAYEQARIDQIRKMDDPSSMDDLVTLGKLAAEKQIAPEHLPAAFDLAA